MMIFIESLRLICIYCTNCLYFWALLMMLNDSADLLYQILFSFLMFILFAQKVQVIFSLKIINASFSTWTQYSSEIKVFIVLSLTSSAFNSLMKNVFVIWSLTYSIKSRKCIKSIMLISHSFNVFCKFIIYQFLLINDEKNFWILIHLSCCHKNWNKVFYIMNIISMLYIFCRE
jgi:hypothetical protein